MSVFVKVFCNERPQLPHSFLRISQILIFLPQLYDYYLSSPIFSLKISYILPTNLPVYLTLALSPNCPDKLP